MVFVLVQLEDFLEFDEQLLFVAEGFEIVLFRRDFVKRRLSCFCAQNCFLYAHPCFAQLSIRLFIQLSRKSDVFLKISEHLSKNLAKQRFSTLVHN